jgi:hypothetical protein
MRSAKAGGERLERDTADFLASTWDDRIDRRVKTGAKDKGDIANFRIAGKRVVVECKDVVSSNIGGWYNEAQVEAANDGAVAGIVVAKRRGKGQPQDQWVHMTTGDLITLLRLACDHGHIDLDPVPGRG